MQKFVKLTGSVVVVLALAACASSSPDVIQRGDAQRLAQVQDGVVLSVRNVVVDGSQSGIGAAVGGVVGAIGGAAGSGVQREAQVLGVLAGVAGAAAGNHNTTENLDALFGAFQNSSVNINTVAH